MSALPVRVQLSRRKGWRIPPNTVVVARPSRWGNPYKVGVDGTQAQCVEAFEQNWGMYIGFGAIIEHLRGRNLACWCATGTPCHADKLLELANGLPGEQEIRRRWYWDGKPPEKATRANILLAVIRTGNSYGITCNGGPYAAPVKGAEVIVYCHACHANEPGVILEVRSGLDGKRGGDPETKIELRCGRVVYLFQTALTGYLLTKLPDASKSNTK